MNLYTVKNIFFSYHQDPCLVSLHIFEEIQPLNAHVPELSGAALLRLSVVIFRNQRYSYNDLFRIRSLQKKFQVLLHHGTVLSRIRPVRILIHIFAVNNKKVHCIRHCRQEISGNKETCLYGDLPPRRA